MFILAVIITAVLAELDPASTRDTTPRVSGEEYWRLWKKFKKDHRKDYPTFIEHNKRFMTFVANVNKINKHNTEGHSWFMGINQFADMTGDEFKEKIVGGCTLPARDDSNVVILDEVDLPTSVDWDAQGKVTPVKNQGQCGSCWAFSTTGSVESRYAIQYGTLNSLSEQELVDCSGVDGNNGCNGGLMDYAFQYIIDENGLCSESGFSYTAKTERFKCASGRSACGGRLDPIRSFTDVQQNSESQLAAAVAQGPVSIAIEADQQAFQLYDHGILNSYGCGAKLDHGVLVVGYGVENGESFWKVKNSWGATWGEQGYIRMCKDCGKNGGAGECGIAAQPSYPNP